MQHLPLVFYIDLPVLVILFSASLSCLFSALEKYHKAAEAAQSAFAEFESKDVRLQEVIILWEVFWFFFGNCPWCNGWCLLCDFSDCAGVS